MIKKAEIADIPAIQMLYSQQFAYMKNLRPDLFCEGSQDSAFIQSIIKDESADILLAQQGGEALGFVLLQLKETPPFSFFIRHRFVYLMDIIVSEKSRGKGIGRKLMDAARDWGRQRGAEYMDLDVLSNNASSIAFYECYGFADKRKTMSLVL